MKATVFISFPWFPLLICTVSRVAAQQLNQTVAADSGFLSGRQRLSGVSDECNILASQPVSRPLMLECPGKYSLLGSRATSLPLTEDTAGIFATDCVNGCFIRVRPGPNKLCLCLNSTGGHREVCNRGYRVYDTFQACMYPADEVLAPKDDDGPPIDPTTYLAPQPAQAECSSPRTVRTTADSCPHMQNGLSLWEDPNTWGGQLPTPGTWATLPEGAKVLVTACSVKESEGYAGIIIPQSSELIFSDEDINFSVSVIYVQGHLRIGGPECRILSKITITFHYVDDQDVFFPDLGIFVQKSGQLDLHGELFTPTWTKLGNTAKPGDNHVTLKEPVNWRPGQLVVLTTTVWKDEWNNQNEVLRIKEVTEDNYTLTFETKLKFHHFGGKEYQAEVGLLSRNIILQGSEASQAIEKGGGVRIEGQGRLSGVMAYRMGQKNVLGAYPFHFHMLGDARDSFITDCSVYKSYFRGVVVHRTNHVLVKENVAFDITGHCFYFEDGVEENNWVEKNLAAFVHVIGCPAGGDGQEGQSFEESPDLIQPSDSAAACFYFPNAHNTILNNVASGGWTGYSFPRLDFPLQRGITLSQQNEGFIPHRRPLLKFDGNTAHSSGYYWYRGSCIYFGGHLWWEKDKLHYNSGRYCRDPRREFEDNAYDDITNTKVFLCNRGINHWGSRSRLVNYEAYEITRGATLFGDGLIKNAKFSLNSGNEWSRFPGHIQDIYPIAGFQWYDDSARTILVDTEFEGYKFMQGEHEQSAFFTMTHSDEFKPSGISASRNITYVDVDDGVILRHDKAPTGSYRFFNWIDYDGSSIKKNSPMVIGSNSDWWKMSDDCEKSWDVWICPKVAGQEIARLDIHVKGLTIPVKQEHPRSTKDPTIIGYASQFLRYKGDRAKSVLLTNNEGLTGMTGDNGWYVQFYNGAPSELELFMVQIPIGTSILFATRYPAGTSISVERIFKHSPRNTFFLEYVNSIKEVQNGNGDRYYFDGNYLYIKLQDSENALQYPTFSEEGIIIHPNRWFDASYKITTDLGCSLNNGARFCPVMADGPPFIDHQGDVKICFDIPPPDGFSCEQQKSWGKCTEKWMEDGNYCRQTCGLCSPPAECCDIQPPDGFSCEQQKSWGKCTEKWMKDGNYCRNTCGLCSGTVSGPEFTSPPECFDIQPPDGYSCEEQKSWGKCGETWMLEGNYCSSTCERCLKHRARLTSRTLVGPQEKTDNQPNLTADYCQDIPPPGQFSCHQHKTWKTCEEGWMEANGWCAISCGRCSLDECTNVPPPDGTSCSTVVSTGQCSDRYLAAASYCDLACNRCEP